MEKEEKKSKWRWGMPVSNPRPCGKRHTPLPLGYRWLFMNLMRSSIYNKKMCINLIKILTTHIAKAVTYKVKSITILIYQSISSKIISSIFFQNRMSQNRNEASNIKVVHKITTNKLNHKTQNRT